MNSISKTARVRSYLQHGIFTPLEISEIVGVNLRRVYVIRWQMRKGRDGVSYGAIKMRQYRSESRSKH